MAKTELFFRFLEKHRDENFGAIIQLCIDELDKHRIISRFLEKHRYERFQGVFI